jgi:hypothetical protein
MTWRRRAVGAVLVSLALAAAVVTAAPPVSSTTGSSAQQLADRYAPVVVLRRHDGACGDPGEPFVPMMVDAVLGNPDVALRQVGNGDAVIKWAPTARDLYDRGQGVYLDLPGDSLRPGCIYADAGARYAPLSRSAVYAHVTQQADRPGFVAVQYWLYWYYNDWNDKHESDWEFVQVLLRASSVEQALSTSPDSVGYAQHTGGEVSDWTSDKLEREGTHPVVYSSERSHANYVQPALFLGRGPSEGFGCDNTQPPSTRLRPRVVLLPDAASGPDDPFAWLAFQGRWGERQPSPNDGPTGPATKPRWSEPVSWQEGLRPSSFVVPGGSAAAPDIVDAFCGVVGHGSVLFIDFIASPAKVLTVVVVLGWLLLFLLRRTSWRSVPPLPVVSRRSAGEILRAAALLYLRRPGAFAALGAITVPVAVLATLVTAVLTHLPLVGPAATVLESDGPGGKVLISSAVAALFWPLGILLVTAAVAALIGARTGGPADQDVDLDAVRPDGGSPRPADALRSLSRHAADLASSFVPAVAVIVLLSLTVVGLPVAAWLTVRYQYLAQVTMLDGVRGRGALASSGRLVRGRWLHTALLATLVWAAVAATGVVLGLLLLVTVTGLPLWTVSAVVVVCQVALVPLGSIVLTLLYGDATAQREGSQRHAVGVS